jgi:hypothetical protein
MKSSVEKECFALIQEIAVKRHPRCKRCGDPSQCGHHIFTRSRPATAFLPEAVIGLCAECHDWIERHPDFGAALAVSILGREEYDHLSALSRVVCRYRAADYREIRDGLRKILEDTKSPAVSRRAGGG